MFLVAMFAAAAAALPAPATPAVRAPEATFDCTVVEAAPAPPRPSAGCEAFVAAGANPGEQADRLFRVGYLLNTRRGGAIAARGLLERAAGLAPGNGRIWHELAYTLAELGEYLPALDAIERAVKLRPNSGDALLERAIIKRRLGQFAGAAKDFDEVVLRGGNDAVLPALAESQIWLGQFGEARVTFERMAKLPGAEAEIARLRGLLERQERARGADAKACAMPALAGPANPAATVDACTAAYFAAQTDAARADALTLRGTARRVELQRAGAAFDDLEVAAGLDPQNPLRWTNYGFALIGVRRPWAARAAFDRALALAPAVGAAGAVTLAGRAEANYHLGDAAAAQADAAASIALEPTALALEILGDLARDRKDTASARAMWLAAYKAGARGDALLASLKAVGVDDPAAAPVGEKPQ